MGRQRRITDCVGALLLWLLASFAFMPWLNGESLWAQNWMFPNRTGLFLLLPPMAAALTALRLLQRAAGLRPRWFPFLDLLGCAAAAAWPFMALLIGIFEEGIGPAGLLPCFLLFLPYAP